jgi:RimJ/RimL family protein N-acetyltransferase
MLRQVFALWGWETAVSYIDPANEASLRMAKRLGATHDPDAVQSDPTEPDSIWRHKREDWL